MAPSCRGKCLEWAVKITNFVVTVIGFGLLAYGIYLIVEAKTISVMSGVALGLGVIDTSMGILLTCCGTRSVFSLRLYMMVVGLVVIAQIALSALFLVDSTQQKIIEAINPPADLKDWVENNLNTTGYVLMALVVFQSISLFFALLQSCAVDTGFQEDTLDEESLLGGGYLSGFGYDKASKKDNNQRKDKFGALEDEGLGGGGNASASQRYRDKHGSYYSKYGIR